ncbi:MAG: hypothetical protein QG552_2960 [Thermodesulfobacteriota bacterium]|nr:hypothetical protein [Thermodesulfobacteriota bacterium]
MLPIVRAFLPLLMTVLFALHVSSDLTHANTEKDAESSNQTIPVVKRKQPSINIALNLHMDPWGRKEDSPEELMIQYEKHRDAFLWLCNLAKQKGFKITAEITGFYAEYVIRQKHVTDFRDFMPGKTHFLGTHLHENYKTNNTPYVWAQSWDSKDAQKIFRDQISMINRIFESLGCSKTDNHLIHGVVVESEDPETLYGARDANNNPYPNYFDIVTGYGLLNHPYRTNSDGLRRRVPLEDLKGRFIAIPKPTPGFMGIIHVPLGPPQRVNLTLPMIQKDFILEYIEWKTYNVLDLPPRPWIFAFDIHPLDLNAGLIGGDGKEIRKTFAQFYEWINENFRDVSRYATSADVATEYLKWEKKNPDTLMYGAAGKSDVGQSDFLTKNIYYHLKGYGPHSFVYYAEYTLDQNKVYDFTRHIHEHSFLIVPNGITPTIDLSRLISGSVKVISRSGIYTMDSASNIPISVEPVLVTSER